MRFSVQCLVVTLWLLNIAPALSGTAASGPSATPFVLVQKLYVSVSAPSTIENVIKSGLLKRLRQFNDVEIEEDIGSADKAVYVIAVEQTDLEPTSYAISIVHANPEIVGVLRLLAQMFAKTQEEKSEAEAIIKDYRNSAIYESQAIYTCSQAQLGHILDVIVADIDSSVLEPTRQMNQRVKRQVEDENRRPKKSSGEK
jgi:hypothetical protein